MAETEFAGEALDGWVTVTAVHGRIIDVQVETEAMGLGYDTLTAALREAANDALSQAADAMLRSFPDQAERRAQLDMARRRFYERLESHHAQARSDREFFGEIVGRIKRVRDWRTNT